MRHQKIETVMPMVLGLTIGLSAMPVKAVPTVSPGFFSTQNAAEDFFKIGRKRLQREIKLLEHRQNQRSEKILHIDEQTRLNEKELENGDDAHPSAPTTVD